MRIACMGTAARLSDAPVELYVTPQSGRMEPARSRGGGSVALARTAAEAAATMVELGAKVEDVSPDCYAQ